MKNLGLSGRKSPAQNILILLIESGLIYLGFQVNSRSVIFEFSLLVSISVYGQATYLGLTLRESTDNFGPYAFASIYFSLSVSVVFGLSFHSYHLKLHLKF